MFAGYLASAINAAHPSQLDPISRDLWRAHGAGSLSDAEAQSLAEALEARRPLCRDRRPVTWVAPLQGRLSIFPQRRPQHARKHPVRISRRRRLASSGPMPPQLAAAWTTGELAVLRIVADETGDGTGVCSRTLGEIAARAGVSRSLAQATLRRAERVGLVAIQERRRRGQKNLPNVVKVISREWRTWLQRGPRTGSRNLAPTDTDSSLNSESGIKGPSCKASRRGRREPHPLPPD